MGRRRRRRPLPGEGSDRLGTNFDRGLPAGDPDEVVNLSINTGMLGDFVQELTALAAEYRRNLEVGHWQARELVSMFLGLPMLRAFWPMTSVDEGGDVYDLSGQGRTLTGNGALAFGVPAGGLAPSVDFGTLNLNRYLSRADEDGLNWDGLDSFMALAWVKPSFAGGAAVWVPLLSKGDESGTLEYGVWVHGSTLRLKVAAGDKEYTAPESRALVDGAWNFIAAGYDGAADEFVVFINGWFNRVQGNSPTLAATTDDFYVGRVDAGVGSRRWRGAMSMAGFYGEVLGQEVLASVYEGSRLAYGQ